MKIELETPNGFYQAKVEHVLPGSCEGGNRRRRIDLASLPESLALFLLATPASCAWRALRSKNGCFAARLEVVFDRLPSVPRTWSCAFGIFDRLRLAAKPRHYCKMKRWRKNICHCGGSIAAPAKRRIDRKEQPFNQGSNRGRERSKEWVQQ